ncbi:MAG: site-2 protease family protein [Chitinispirillia bacterium]|jgi:Zn-dependent protease
MKWSWRIGAIKGIDIHIHYTFLLLLGWFGLGTLISEQSIAASISSMVYILLLFTIVVLHELGHSLTASHFGISTRRITLLPIGGVAQLEKMPENPKQELLVSIAGPAVNIVLALILFIISIFSSAIGSVTGFTLIGTNLLSRLILVNVGLAVFNLLPAFPMDGGRVLRALLAFKRSYLTATETALKVSKVFAVLFGVVGLFTNPFLILIAIFVWISGSQEYEMVKIKHEWKSSLFPETAFENIYSPHSNFWIHIPRSHKREKSKRYWEDSDF